MIKEREKTMQLTKDKEFILITENRSTRKININTGVYIGVKGGEIQKLPSETKNKLLYENNIRVEDSLELYNFKTGILYIMNNGYNRNDEGYKELRAKCLQLVEFCNYLKLTVHDISQNFYSILEEKKEFANWIKETKVRGLNYRTFSDYKEYKKELKYQAFKKLFTEDSPISLKTYMGQFSDLMTEEHISFVLYFLKNDIGYLSTVYYGNYWNSPNISLIRQYFKACAELNKKPEKTRDLTREMAETIKTAKFIKETAEAKILQGIYSKYEDLLNFENDNFKVVIPTCAGDFAKESNQQSNCVRSYYESVLQEQTLVVFIRKKSALDKSYITCEIGLPNKRIRQYLLKNNYGINEAQDIQFFEAFKQHIATHS